jgi:hypothetical protein
MKAMKIGNTGSNVEKHSATAIQAPADRKYGRRRLIAPSSRLAF